MPAQQKKPQYFFKFKDGSVVVLTIDQALVEDTIKRVNTLLTCRAMNCSSGFIKVDLFDDSFSFSVDDLLYIKRKEVSPYRSVRDIRLEERNGRIRDDHTEDDDEEDDKDDDEEDAPPKPRRPVGGPRKTGTEMLKK